jgi:hypothetical protein
MNYIEGIVYDPVTLMKLLGCGKILVTFTKQAM